MNPHLPPPSPDDVDRAFSQYFRAHMPRRWPAPPVPAEPAPVRAAGSWQVRLTLAASVAAVLALGFAVSYGPGLGRPNSPGGGFDTPPVADGNKLHNLMQDPPMDVRP